jgi:hypothetical protein
VKSVKANTTVATPEAMRALLNDALNRDNWAIVDAAPTFENGWEDLKIQMYFPQGSQVKLVRVAAVFECFQQQDLHAIISFITWKLKDSPVQLNIPAAYIRYNTLVGDGAHTRNKKQQLLKQRLQLDAEGRFLEGPLYHSSQGRECQYVAGEFLKLDRVWHERALEDSLLTNDCIGHAVNYGVRGPLFTYREQLQRLA